MGGHFASAPRLLHFFPPYPPLHLFPFFLFFEREREETKAGKAGKAGKKCKRWKRGASVSLRDTDDSGGRSNHAAFVSEPSSVRTFQASGFAAASVRVSSRRPKTGSKNGSTAPGCNSAANRAYSMNTAAP